jgi:putative membrane protein
MNELAQIMWGIGWFWWLMVILIFALFIWIVNRALITNKNSPPKNKSPLSILEQRYAQGEISKDDYNKMKQELKQ